MAGGPAAAAADLGGALSEVGGLTRTAAGAAPLAATGADAGTVVGASAGADAEAACDDVEAAAGTDGFVPVAGAGGSTVEFGLACSAAATGADSELAGAPAAGFSAPASGAKAGRFGFSGASAAGAVSGAKAGRFGFVAVAAADDPSVAVSVEVAFFAKGTGFWLNTEGRAFPDSGPAAIGATACRFGSGAEAALSAERALVPAPVGFAAVSAFALALPASAPETVWSKPRLPDIGPSPVSSCAGGLSKYAAAPPAPVVALEDVGCCGGTGSVPAFGTCSCCNAGAGIWSRLAG